MRRSLLALAVLAFLTLGAQLLLASVPEEPAAEPEAVEAVAETIAAQPLPPVPLCTEEPAPGLVLVDGLLEPPLQLACNCFACFDQCGFCGVNNCRANPCNCNCRICAID